MTRGGGEQTTSEPTLSGSTVVDAPLAKQRADRNANTPAATRAEGAPAPSSATPSARDAQATSFANTLRAAEIARTRLFVPIVIAMAFAALALIQFVGGDPLARRLLYVGVTACIAAVIYLYSLARNPESFTEGRIALAYGVCIVGVFTGVFYWGIFSPVAAIVALGIFFVGIGRSTRVATMLYLVCVLCQGGLAAAMIGGAISDPGLVTADRSETGEEVLQQVMLQIVYLVTYLVARATRNQLDQAVSDHDAAVRAVAQRDALLVEAREDLDRALKIGAAGRYTDQVIGNFRFGVVLGRGAMGDVYEAVHVETGAPAAIKLPGAATHATPGALARFYREAQAAAKLESPHIVRLIDVSSADAPIPYIAMERLHGRDLAQLLRERRRLSLREVVELAQQVARGLETARRAGIVHRDIKPQNLFLADSAGGGSIWKLLDFGVSKLEDHQGTLTRDQVVGTPMYMAPEQARGQPVDHRADVFALATVVYRATTGQPPYGGRDVPSILYHVVHKIPERPGELAKLPRDLDRVLALALAKRPDDRFATAIEFADALMAAMSSQLDRELRARADAVIAAHPWGSGG